MEDFKDMKVLGEGIGINFFGSSCFDKNMRPAISTDRIHVLFMDSGTLKLRGTKGDITICPGHLGLWNPRHPVRILKVEGDLALFTISFTLAFAVTYTPEDLRQHFFPLLMTDRPSLVQLDIKGKMAMAELLLDFSAREQLGETTLLYRQAMSENFGRLVLHLLKGYTDYPRQTGQSARNRLVTEFLILVDGNCRQWHSRYRYADRLAVTPHHLSKQIRSALGRTTKDIIHDRLLREAKIQLGTDRAIGDVGEELGFGSASTFSRFFKSRTSLSPSQYREGLGVIKKLNGKGYFL
ncbi:MAG: helix-turn-helix domain-containing protein [Sediminicola sp.]